MIERDITDRRTALFGQYPFVTVTGPRQSGKTTLCRVAFPDLRYANLEAPDQRDFAESDPRGFSRSSAKERDPERCSAVCYRCIVASKSQRDHHLLDRRTIRDILVRLTHSEVHVHGGGETRAAAHQHEDDLLPGALIVVDCGRSRVRVLPT